MWLYKNKVVSSIQDMPESCYGFVYKILHIPTGKKYIGKKVLYFNRNVKLTKKELELLKEQRKEQGLGGRTPLKKKVVKESDWKTYYGSHKDILNLVKESKESEFAREILKFTFNKKELTYYEVKFLFIEEVLEKSNEYINDNILGKFFTKDFKHD